MPATKPVYFWFTPGGNPVQLNLTLTQIATLDAAADAGGWFTFTDTSGQLRINWAQVTQYKVSA